MNIHEIIQKAIETSVSVGLQQRVDSLWAEEKALLEPRYRVAFVGQFKTGKSTLINRLILKERVLFTDVLEATAIPTEIDFAEKPRLEVYRYEKNTYRLEAGGHEVEQAYVCGSVLDRVVDNPTFDQIRQATSGETPEARAATAETYSHARLFWPAENLRHFTAVDTPGIDSPNDAVVTTTYRILPQCDAAIFVARPGMLSQVDIQFLRSKVFESGITRCMVVLHYDPRFSDVSAAQIAKIKETVRAQLADIGRQSVEVTAAEVSRLDGLEAGQLAQAVVAQASTVDSWLDGESAVVPRTAETSNQSLSIERDLVRFINENIRPAKEEKIANRVRRIVELALAECQMELALIEKSQQERAALNRTLANRQQSHARETTEIKEEVLGDLRLLRQKHLVEIAKGLDLVERRFNAEIKTCKSLDDIQTRLRNLKPIVTLEVEDLALHISERVRTQFREIEQKYAVRLHQLGETWKDLDVALSIDGGLLERIPGSFVGILDYLLVVLVSPLPFFVDIPLRWLASQMPGLNKLLPANLAGSILVNLLEQSALDQFDRIRDEISSKLEVAYAEAETTLSQAWDMQAAEQANMVEAVTQRADQTPDPGRSSTLRRAIDSFKNLMGNLSTTRSPS